MSNGTAVISECGQYRYMLTRDIALENPGNFKTLFVMLNPSTADATEDDPTIRRCISFAKGWGCPSLTVANLYAFRATDPRELKRQPAGKAVGPENDAWLRRLLLEHHRQAVCAWGANADPERVEQFLGLALETGSTLWCLGTTKAGQPKHPLYLRRDTPLVRFFGRAPA
jgi:hypothetical protein